MLTLKIVIACLLVYSDFLFFIGFLKYSASHGDPRPVESAKMQIIYSFITHIFCCAVLIALHAYQGINLQSYNSLDIIVFWTFAISLAMFLLGLLSMKVSTFFQPKSETKITAFWGGVIMVLCIGGFLLASLSFQIFLLLITF